MRNESSFKKQRLRGKSAMGRFINGFMAFGADAVDSRVQRIVDRDCLGDSKALNERR